ncbi:hypothetical protein GOODEAATRI_010139, partial [Goodea atripinnis]
VEDTNDKSESNADPRIESYRALDERNSDPELQTPNKKRRKGRWERKERGKIFCKVCGVFYRQFGSLVRHIWMHVSDPQRVCGACGEKSESVDQLKEHIHSHKKPYSCPDCGKPFFSKDGVKRHAAKHTGSNLFECSVCGKSSPNQYTLNLHRWVHIENKPHKCDICPKSFGLESQLRAHRKRHMANDAYKCHMCNKSLRSRRSLARHMLTHSDERRYSCETCGNRFKSDAGLKSHEKTHEVRDRPFLCHICCMTFPLKQSLMSHLRIHSSERPFVCSLCGKGFTFQGNLNKHMKAHTSEAPFKCCECGRCFKHKNHLTQHIKIHSGIKQFVCGVCGKGCSNQEHLKVHMRTHTGERPYECSLCDRAFTQSHCLKTHMKTHQNNDEAVLEKHQPLQESELQYYSPTSGGQSPSLTAAAVSVCGDAIRDAVKKPLNAFMLYMKEMRHQVQQEGREKESSAINRILGRKDDSRARGDRNTTGTVVWTFFSRKLKTGFHHTLDR